MVSAQALLGDGAKLEVPSSAIMMVMITQFIDTLAGSMSTPVMPYYAKAFHVSTANIGWLYGLWSFSSTVFAPFLTRLADKIGRRPVLIMSLVGAGVANLIQGSALWFGEWGFTVFLFGRFFSGMWAAVGATCNVYITDVCPEELRAQYIAKMSTVPLVALLFGPGLGGGLSKLGLNVPVAVDGVVTLFSACLVSYYLPETPSFLRSRRGGSADAATGPQEPVKSTPVPRVVYWLGFTQFLGGVAFSTVLSGFGLFFLERYELDSLRVGFVMMSCSIAMIAANVWAVPFLKPRLTVPQVIIAGAMANGVAVLLFAFAPNMWASMGFLMIAFAGNALRGSNSTAYTGTFTDATNRGSVFSIAQTFMNTGRMVGPVLGTHLIAWYDVSAPFVMACVVNVASAVIVSMVERWSHEAEQATIAANKPVLERKGTLFGDEWVDEEGSPEDIAELGKFMAKLLSQKHYRWVSRKDCVRSLLEGAIPELNIADRKAYYCDVSNVFQRVEGRSVCG